MKYQIKTLSHTSKASILPPINFHFECYNFTINSLIIKKNYPKKYLETIRENNNH